MWSPGEESHRFKDALGQRVVTHDALPVVVDSCFRFILRAFQPLGATTVRTYLR
jgi:hypothetical protein